MPHQEPLQPAILADSAPRLRAQAAAVTLRIWHHLANDDAGLLLFEPFRTNGHAYPLIEALVMSATDPALRFKLPFPPDRVRDHRNALASALAHALDDIFGEAGRGAMASAWGGVLHRLLEHIAARAERHSV